MDTKQLFIKTQLNVSNWAIGISSILFLLSIIPLTNIQNMPNSSYIPMVTNLAILVFLIRARLKICPKSALIALGSFSVLLLYYIVMFFATFPKAMTALKNSGTVLTPRNYILMALSILVGYGMFGLCGFLYYKAFKGISVVKSLKESPC